jgi:glyoxylase-like metal-dependent hydrolase (beta-lactamase superfamily II)
MRGAQGTLGKKDGDVTLTFDQKPPEGTGQLVEVAPGIRRIVAGNGGPFTFTGTCTYVVGRGEVTVIDPGPDSPEHIAALIAGLGGEEVADILITHTHRDHSPGARLLKDLTGARLVGCAPHRAFRAPLAGEATRLDASADMEFVADLELADGDVFAGAGGRFRAIATPGHTANHLMFDLEGTGMVFSGDHVMAWSTTIVAPPDGAMGPYMASLERLIVREEDRAYWPGHGGPVADPKRFTRGLLSHRRQRETQILDRLKLGPQRIPDLVAANYPGLDPRLTGAAALSVFAHIEDLQERGAIGADGEASLSALYRLA